MLQLNISSWENDDDRDDYNGNLLVGTMIHKIKVMVDERLWLKTSFDHEKKNIKWVDMITKKIIIFN